MSEKAPTDEEILAKADRVAESAEKMRAKGDDAGADRAAQAAEDAREFVRRQRLVATEADNYARANAPHPDDTKE